MVVQYNLSPRAPKQDGVVESNALLEILTASRTLDGPYISAIYIVET